MLYPIELRVRGGGLLLRYIVAVNIFVGRVVAARGRRPTAAEVARRLARMTGWATGDDGEGGEERSGRDSNPR